LFCVDVKLGLSHEGKEHPEVVRHQGYKENIWV